RQTGYIHTTGLSLPEAIYLSIIPFTDRRSSMDRRRISRNSGLFGPSGPSGDHISSSSSSSSSQDKTVQNGSRTLTEKIARSTSSSSSSSSSQEGGPQQKYILQVVFVSLIIDLLAFTVILPIFPSILDYYQKHDQSLLYRSLEEMVQYFQSWVGIPPNARWNAVLFGGMIGSMFSLLQFVSSPIIGIASDVYGRKPILLVSMVGVAVSHLLWSLSSSFLLFIVARVIGGVSKGNIGLSTAIVTDVSTAEKRGRGMALIGIAFSLGFIFGPFMGSLFTRMAGKKQQALFALPATFALGLVITDILFISFCLTESLPPAKRAKSLLSSWKQTSHLLNPVSLFRFSVVQPLKETDKSSIRTIGCVYFLYLFIFSGLEFTLTFLTHSRFGYSSIQQGKMFVYIGSFMALIQGGYTRRVPFGKEKKVAFMGMAALIPTLVILSFATSQLALYFALGLFAFCSASVVPCLTTVISRFGKDSQKGAIVGVFRSLGALARALGPMALCTVYWLSGPTFCYCACAVALLLPLFVLHHFSIEQSSVTS
ncbi:major facilitator superfamily domain-containing protein 10-like, partial [Argonauta hians]